MSLGAALTSAILPVLSVAAVGFVLGRRRTLDVDALNTITIYVLTPALVFYSLATTPLGGASAAKIVLGVVAFTVAMVVIAEAVGRFVGETEPVLGALVLSSTFPNAGNFGIPLSAFAFGAIGRSTAVLFITGQALMMYTLGIYVASRGDSRSTLSAVGEVFSLPLIYAVIAAAVARWFDLLPPIESSLMQTLRLTGDAAIPVMLLLLGIQLANTDHGAAISRVGTANVLKLVVAPIVAVGVVLSIGLTGTVGRVFILECATPVAITPLLLTIEFGNGNENENGEMTGAGAGDETGIRSSDHGTVTAPEYVSTAVFTSTLASIATLTLLITWLQSGGIV